MGIELTRVFQYGGRRAKPAGWKAKLGPIDVVRPTQREAQAALSDLIEAQISGSFEPAMFSIGDASVLVYRTIEGWCYRVWSGVRAFGPMGAVVQMGLGESRDKAIRAAKIHLAQIVWPESNGLDLLAGDRVALTTHMRWVSFQRAYEAEAKRLRDAGQPNDDIDLRAHGYASRNADAYGSWLTFEERAAIGQ